MIRPWGVLKADISAWWRWFTDPKFAVTEQTFTWYETQSYFGIVTSVHHIQISTSTGRLLYKTPHWTDRERRAFIVKHERIKQAVRDALLRRKAA
jgi:hypothetical protein